MHDRCQFLYLQLYLDLPFIHLAPIPQNLAQAVPRLAPTYFIWRKRRRQLFCARANPEGQKCLLPRFPPFPSVFEKNISHSREEKELSGSR